MAVCKRILHNFLVFWMFTVSAIVTAVVMFLLLAGPDLVVANTIQISGKVSDQTGDGIANAEVRVFNKVIDAGGYGMFGGELVGTGDTDSTGDYVIQVPPAIYDVRVIAPPGSAFTGAAATNLVISANTTLNFVLPILKQVETSLREALVTQAVLEVRVEKVVNNEGAPATLQGGIGSYEATLEFDNTCMTISTESGIHHGGNPFNAPVANIVGGNKLLLAQVLGSTADQVQPPLTVAKVVLQLTGSVTKACAITLTKMEVSENSVPQSSSQQVRPPPQVFLRGDADGNGEVDRNDALFIAEYVLGLKQLGEDPGQVRIIQGAGVNHDGSEGDKLDVTDVLFILQYVVQLRDSAFNLN